MTSNGSFHSRRRRKLANGVDARGLEQNIMEIVAAKKIYAKNLLKETAEAMGLDKQWLNETSYTEEMTLLW